MVRNAGRTKPAQVVNFAADGTQLTRFDTAGEAIDAHDGEIAFFNGTYYLYGTSYDCGFAWQDKEAPFCGFKVYSSPGLVSWQDRGYLFDARTPVWQARCNGSTYGCFRPHVVFNEQTRQYVLWINVYDNQVGFRVFTSPSPLGPFSEAAPPVLAVNSQAPASGLNNGDHDTFVDDDGKAYLAYTDWRAKGAIVIEQLTADYLSGTGRCVQAVTPGQTEAPALFKRRGRYYLTYSDPNCGYCAGTGTSYRTAAAPLGPWSSAVKLSENSCGGQPSFVSTIKLGPDSLFLYGSDLWNHGACNEALANYYWAPLVFNADGSLQPLVCRPAGAKQPATLRPVAASSSAVGEAACLTGCVVTAGQARSQPFVAAKTGLLTTLTITAFKQDKPNAALRVAIYADEAAIRPLYASALPADSIGWAAGRQPSHPHLPVVAGRRYWLRLSSATTAGCYGLAYTPAAGPAGRGGPAPGATKNSQALKLQLVIQRSR